MSTLIKRGDIYHYQWCINGKAHRKSLKTADLATAKRLQRTYDARLEHIKTGTAPSRVPAADSLAAFVEAKKATLRAGSIISYRDHAKVIAGWLESVGVKYWHQLNPVHVETFVAEQMKLISPKTVSNRVGVLRACLNWLWRSSRLDTLPIRQWPNIKKVSRRPDRLQHYSADEIRLLAEYFKDKPFFPVFQFACYTGARRDEIKNARVGDILFGDSTIRLHSIKTESDATDQIRAVELADALRPGLEDRTRGRAPGELLFPEFAEHSRNWPHVQMQAACADLAIGYKRFHGLRHSYASYLLDGGEDLLRVMDAMGHKRLETTQKYLHRVRKASVARLGY